MVKGSKVELLLRIGQEVFMLMRCFFVTVTGDVPGRAIAKSKMIIMTSNVELFGVKEKKMRKNFSFAAKDKVKHEKSSLFAINSTVEGRTQIVTR